MSYPYSGGGYPGGGGYPQQPGYPQQGGYPPQQGGYPQQGGFPQPGGYPQAGYPQQGGYPPQSGFPQPGGYQGGTAGIPGSYGAGYNQPGAGMPGGMPMPDYGSGSPYASGGGGLPYPAQPGAAGFGQPGGPAMPLPNAGMPAFTDTGPGQAYGMPPAGPAYNTPAPNYPSQPPYTGGSQPGYGGASQPYGYPAPGQPAQPAHPAPPARPATNPSYPATGTVPTHDMRNLSISASTKYKVKTQGTVTPVQPFDPEADCKILRKAMKGMGTDEKAIIDILAQRGNEQRARITEMYKTMYGKDLIKELKSELGGKLETVILALLNNPALYDATEMKRGLQGLGTDEATIIEIMCSRDNKQIKDMKAAYKTVFKKDLEKDLTGDTSGHFRRLMVSMSMGNRPEGTPVDMAKAQASAKELYEAGEARLGTDESAFNRILASQSYEQLRAVFDEYAKVSKKSIEKAIQSEMSGDLAAGMLAIVKVVRNRPAYFAETLYNSMKGLGTQDQTLIRVIVTRCEVDMVQIKQEFQQKYGKSLESFILGDCSGDYKRVLIALVK